MPSPAVIDSRVPKSPEEHLSDALTEVFQTLDLGDITPEDIINRFNKSGGIDRVRIAIERRMKQFTDAQQRHTVEASEHFLNELPDTEGLPPQQLIQQAQHVVLSTVKDRIGRDVDSVTEQGNAPWFLDCVREEIINACKEQCITTDVKSDVVPPPQAVDGAQAILKNLTRSVTRARQVEHAHDPAKLNSKKESHTNGHVDTASNGKLSQDLKENLTTNGNHAPNKPISAEAKVEKVVVRASDNDQKQNKVPLLSSDDKDELQGTHKPKQEDRPLSNQALPSKNNEQPTGAQEAMTGVKEETNLVQSDKDRQDYDSLAEDLLLGGGNDNDDDRKDRGEPKAVKEPVFLSNSEVQNTLDKKPEVQPENKVVPEKDSPANPEGDFALQDRKARELPEKTITSLEEKIENTIAPKKESLAKSSDDTVVHDEKPEEQIKKEFPPGKESLPKPSEDSVLNSPSREIHVEESNTEPLEQARASEKSGEPRDEVPTSGPSLRGVPGAAEDASVRAKENGRDEGQQKEDVKAESAVMDNHVQNQADELNNAHEEVENSNLKRQAKRESEESQHTILASQVQSKANGSALADTGKTNLEKQPKRKGEEAQGVPAETSRVQNKVNETVKGGAEVANSKEQIKEEGERGRSAGEASRVHDRASEPVIVDVGKVYSEKQANDKDNRKDDEEGNGDAPEEHAKSEDAPGRISAEDRDPVSGVRIAKTTSEEEKDAQPSSKGNARDAGERHKGLSQTNVSHCERGGTKESSADRKNEGTQQKVSAKEDINSPVGSEKESTSEKDKQSGHSDNDRRRGSGSDIAQTVTRKTTSPTRRTSSRRSARTIPRDAPGAIDLGQAAKETVAQKAAVANKEKTNGGRQKRKIEESTDVKRESKRKSVKSDGTKSRKETSVKKRRRNQATEDRISLPSQSSAGRPDPAVENWPRGYGIVRSCIPEDYDAQQKVLHTIKMLLEKEYVSPFSEPVDISEKGLEMYVSIIKNPMDLGEVYKRLQNSSVERGYYLNVSEVLQDIELVWWNCKRYNGQFDPIIGACEQAQNEFSFLLEQHGIEAEKGTQKRRRVSRGSAPSIPKLEEDAELGDNDGRLVGKTILVFTELMKRRKKKEWFSVEVKAYDSKSKSYTLLWVNERKTTKKATFGPDKMYPVYRT